MMVFLSVALVAVLSIAVLAHTAYAQGSSCEINVTGIGETYHASSAGACASAVVNVAAHSSQDKVLCSGASPQIGGVTFGNDSFNNTLFNCTFASAQIASLKNASNNLISPYGTYSMSFSDNLSNVAIGHYFTFVSKNYDGTPSTSLFITVVPYAIAKVASVFINSQNLAMNVIRQQALIANYTLPRFGYYASVNSTGIIHFALEQKEVYRNRTVGFNPYWFVTPYWGWDELSYKEFNITGNMNYTPTLVYPTMQENVRFPDNTTIYWNYTVVRYSNATNMTLYIDRGWQGDQNNTLAYVQHNITNGSISYKVGKQAPGIYEYIAILKSPQANEHDNSTTETYGVGLPYCQIGDASQILFPGYYSMPYKNLSILHTFWLNGSLCNIPVDVIVNNVTINCNGGNINSKNVSIEISGVNNTKIENCNIYGNGFRVYNSNGVNVTNTNIIADNSSNTALYVDDSKNVTLSNVSIIGYKGGNQIVNISSMISIGRVSFSNLTNISKSASTTTINYTKNYTTNETGNTASKTIGIGVPSRHAAAPSIDYYYIALLFAAIVAICAVIYYLVSRSIGRSG